MTNFKSVKKFLKTFGQFKIGVRIERSSVLFPNVAGAGCWFQNSRSGQMSVSLTVITRHAATCCQGLFAGASGCHIPVKAGEVVSLTLSMYTLFRKLVTRIFKLELLCDRFCLSDRAQFGRC